LHWDEAMSVATDSAGATYVAGFTRSENARTVRAVRTRHRGIMDAYVAKLTPDGRTRVGAARCASQRATRLVYRPPRDSYQRTRSAWWSAQG
jgi:hypothetical protein